MNIIARYALARLVRAGEFFPHKNAPERGDHRRGLADRIGNRDAGKIRRDKIENRAGGPDRAADQTQHVAAGRPAKKSAEFDRLADQRLLHEINIPEKQESSAPPVSKTAML